MEVTVRLAMQLRGPAAGAFEPRSSGRGHEWSHEYISDWDSPDYLQQFVRYLRIAGIAHIICLVHAAKPMQRTTLWHE